MNKLSILLLFTSLNVLIYSCTKENNNKSGKDNNNCKYEILFDKQFLVNKDEIVKNKEIEDCYIDVKNGKSDVKGKTKSLKRNFFEFDFFNACGLMRIYESDGKLKLIKVTKDNIETNAIYFFGDYDCNSLNFVIFKNINEAKNLNIIYKITLSIPFNKYIDNLLTK